MTAKESFCKVMQFLLTKFIWLICNVHVWAVWIARKIEVLTFNVHSVTISGLLPSSLKLTVFDWASFRQPEPLINHVGHLRISGKPLQFASAKENFVLECSRLTQTKSVEQTWVSKVASRQSDITWLLNDVGPVVLDLSPTMWLIRELVFPVR